MANNTTQNPASLSRLLKQLKPHLSSAVTPEQGRTCTPPSPPLLTPSASHKRVRERRRSERGGGEEEEAWRRADGRGGDKPTTASHSRELQENVNLDPAGRGASSGAASRITDPQNTKPTQLKGKSPTHRLLAVGLSQGLERATGSHVHSNSSSSLGEEHCSATSLSHSSSVARSWESFSQPVKMVSRRAGEEAAVSPSTVEKVTKRSPHSTTKTKEEDKVEVKQRQSCLCI